MTIAIKIPEIFPIFSDVENVGPIKIGKMYFSPLRWIAAFENLEDLMYVTATYQTTNFDTKQNADYFVGYWQVYAEEDIILIEPDSSFVILESYYTHSLVLFQNKKAWVCLDSGIIAEYI